VTEPGGCGVQRLAAHSRETQTALVCSHEPHSPPALLRAKARLGLRPRWST